VGNIDNATGNEVVEQNGVEVLGIVGDAVGEDARRVGLIGGLLLLPFRLLWRTAVVSARVGWYAGRAPIRAGAAVRRLVGWRALVFFMAGVAIGLLLAPERGRDLRERIRRMLAGKGLSDAELADRVEFELSHAPRTWHLPQPEVAVLNGRVELRGSVPHPVGREEIERVAASVPGVTDVENLLVVADRVPSSN
jgi:hypothetical protein